MALLDDFRGKEQIRQLNAQLSEKGTEISNLQSRLAEMSQQYRDSDQEVGRLVKAVADKEAALAALRDSLEKVNVANSLLTGKYDLLKQSATERETLDAALIADLNVKLAAVEPEISKNKAERDKALDENRLLQATYADKDKQYQEREEKLAQKSEQLQNERRKFQQQANELYTREQHWKNVVEPQLRRYEAHCTLDLREQQLNALDAQLVVRGRDLTDLEADLIRRQCTDVTLSAREAEIVEWEKLLSDKENNLQTLAEILNARRRSIDEKEIDLLAEAQRLSALQVRVDRLDKDEEVLLEREKRLEIKKSVQAENHKIKLSEIKADRSALKTLKNQLDADERDIKQREEDVKGEETRQLRLKNKNFELKNEVKRLSDLLGVCEEAQTKASSARDTLQDENATLKTRIAGLVKAAGQIKEATKPKGSSEVEIDGYDPVKHGGEIAPPPPAFRSNTPLTALHYHVGLSGIEDEDERRDLLRSIIVCSFRQLPKVGSPEYMRQWGEGKSPQRVRCIAYHLSWNIGFQGAKGTNELARQHWLDDLKWLTRCYKAKIPASRWPSVPRA